MDQKNFNIEPGGFYEHGPSEPVKPKETQEPTEPETSESFEEKLKVISKEFNINPNFVYSPCSGILVAPAKAFPDAKVVFLDQNKWAVDMLKRFGYNAVVGDALEYVPETPIDLLILENPGISKSSDLKKITDLVKVGGHIICNDYHDTARLISSMPEFKAVGLVTYESDNTPSRVVKSELDTYLLQEKSDFDSGAGEFVFEKIQ